MAKLTQLKRVEKFNIFKEVWKHKTIYLIMLPGILWFIIFAYGPMSGLQLAFKTYSTKLGIWGSPWCGFENFEFLFRNPAFLKSVGTTLWINAGRLLFQFPVPVILALFLNEMRTQRYKKVVQTVLTFPHFLSWVIIASLVINILSYNGLVNSVIAALGGKTINFTGSADIFQPLLYLTDNWKGAGWSAIIYMAAISGIDIEQYEAASMRISS
jgi:putative aldouronate transport system permease protein